MLIFQRPPRTAHFEGLTDDQVVSLFPADIEIEVELTPAAIFGEEPPDPKFQRLMPGDDKILIEQVDGFKGTHTITGSMPFVFARLQGGGKVDDATLTMSGAKTALRQEGATHEDFVTLVTRATNDIAPILSTLFGEAVSVRGIRGNAGGQPFEVKVVGDGDFLVRHDTDNLAPRIQKNFHLLWDCAASPRLRAAMGYLQQAQRLRLASSYPGEFLAERFLNLGKLVEILFTVNDAKQRNEETREQLRALRFPENAIEIISSISYVRSQLDVAHPVLELLTAKDYSTAHFFATRAEDAATYLVMHIAQAFREGKHRLPEPSGAHGSDRNKLMEPMRKHEDVALDPFGDRPSTGVWARVRHRTG